MSQLVQIIKPWLLATRPKTLAAGIIPVLIGTASASTKVEINWLLALIILICSVFIQIITNFINEIYDFKRGADNEDRLGPRRQVASSIISTKAMTIASIVLIIITFSLGMILVAHAGFWILLVGILSLFFAFLYTGGPYPLAYNGLGDVFVFVFFGLVAVSGTYYVFVGSVDWIAIIASIAPGLLSANILAVNNIRDISTDPKANKITLAVKIGKRNAVNLYIALNIFTYLSIVILYFITDNPMILLPFLSLPIAINLCNNIRIKQGIQLNKVLADTGKLLFIFGMLMSIGFGLTNIIVL